MDEEYDYDYDDYDPENGLQDEDQDDQEIELENMYYEAEDVMRDQPLVAIQLFDKIIQQESQLAESARKQSFQSLKNAILLRLKNNGDLNIIKIQLQELLKLFQYQYRNDGYEALNQILEGLVKIDYAEEIKEIFNHFLLNLKTLNLTQLFILANTKLCKVYIERKDVQNLEESIKNIAETVNQIQDQDRKNTILIEFYAYSINLYNMKGDIQKIKEIYRKLVKLNISVHDPRINGIINETIGKMKLIERRWDDARKKLMDAFYNYQDIGDNQAKIVLNQAVLASILGNFEMNLFDDMRTRVYDNDPEVQKMKELRQAFEKQDIKQFNKLKKEFHYLDQFIGELEKVICQQKIISLMSAYKRININFLQNILGIEEQVCIRYIQELILSKKINCLINEAEFYVEKIETKDTSKLEQLIKSL